MTWVTVVVAASSAAGQSARFVGTSLLLSDGPVRIEVPRITSSMPIERHVHSVQKRRGEYFIVVSIRATSDRPPDGYCGAGTETNVQWLRLREGKVVDWKKILIDSCLFDRDGRVTGWRGTLFTFWTRGPEEDTTHYVFDAAHPMNGLQKSFALDGPAT